MTYHLTTSWLTRMAARRGRRALSGVLPLALLLAALSGVAATGQAATRNQAPRVTLAAAQETLLGTYTNGQASVTVKKSVTGTGSTTVVAFIADITVGAATTLRSAFARNTYGQYITELISTMARNNNAVLAINADYYGFRDDGIVIRNGTAYRDKPARQGLGILRDGTFLLYDETTTSASKLLSAGVFHGLSFGPGLVRDGQIPSGIDTYEIGDFGPVQPGAPGSIQGYQPRTGIGMISRNHFVMIVVDGRGAGGSRGVTMPEFAQMFRSAGATTAFNLDGGGSATMYFNGTIINSPAFGSERATSDILYLAR